MPHEQLNGFTEEINGMRYVRHTRNASIWRWGYKVSQLKVKGKKWDNKHGISINKLSKKKKKKKAPFTEKRKEEKKRHSPTKCHFRFSYFPTKITSQKFSISFLPPFTCRRSVLQVTGERTLVNLRTPPRAKYLRSSSASLHATLQLSVKLMNWIGSFDW